ncbi:MAG TPA: FG-GAP repeat protein [Dehalococcoidia bacterium]|nr:FG-GAP repeat protein [Dehalococcoidia bacterium]
MNRLSFLVLALFSVGVASCSGGGSGGVTPSGSAPNGSGSAEGQLLQTLEPARLYAPDAGDQAGAIAAGDFNGDGIPDVVLAAAFADGPGGERADSGAAYVFLGPFQPGQARDAAKGDQAVTVYGAATGDQLGRSVAAGDFNGDGVDDIILGSPFSDGPQGDRKDAGRIDVVLGGASFGEGQQRIDVGRESAFTVYGATAGDLAGFSVTTGRLNGDTAADLVAGAFYAAGPGDSRPLGGEVYVLYGGPRRSGVVDLAAGSADVTVFGAAAGDRLGEGVAAGDVNGDSLDDLVLPAPFAVNLNGAKDAGRTYVIHSPAPTSIDLASFTPAATVYGVDDGDQLGHVSVAGDVDGDGKADLLLTAVSADGPNNTVDLAGEAALILAPSLKQTVDVASGGADSIIYGRDREDRLGRSATMGDIDGDGRMELILGAPGGGGPDDNVPDAGEIYVLPGKLNGDVTAPGPGRVFYGLDKGDALGSEVFGRTPLAAADLDSDGRDEVLVVAPLGDGPDNGRKDCGEALILFITAGNGG